MTGLTPHQMPRYSKDEWWQDAACKEHPWVAEARNTPAIRAAKRLCRSCPVIEDCLAEALCMEARLPMFCRAGVAGGLSKKERFELSRAVCDDCGVKVPLGDVYCDRHKVERRAQSQARYDRRQVRAS